MRIVIALALGLLAAVPIRADPLAQEKAKEGFEAIQNDLPPVLSMSEIVLDQYLVQNSAPEELFDLARRLVGRNYFVKENGGLRGAALENIKRLGRTIVLYDEKRVVDRAREILKRLDVPSEAVSDQTIEYRPRFITVNAALQAAVAITPSVRLVQQSGTIVIRAPDEAVKSVMAMLKRIDVPEKQVILTCQLLEVGAGTGTPPLPKDLLENLQKLLPQSQFSQVGMALLKTSVSGQSRVSLQIDSVGKTYELSFSPVAFDAESGALTVEDCMLRQMTENGSRELFHTNTVLRGNEYTVLGATGATPRLLVVRLTTAS